jgi:hypothetical protein
MNKVDLKHYRCIEGYTVPKSIGAGPADVQPQHPAHR